MRFPTSQPARQHYRGARLWKISHPFVVICSYVNAFYFSPVFWDKNAIGDIFCDIIRAEAEVATNNGTETLRQSAGMSCFGGEKQIKYTDEQKHIFWAARASAKIAEVALFACMLIGSLWLLMAFNLYASRALCVICAAVGIFSGLSVVAMFFSDACRLETYTELLFEQPDPNYMELIGSGVAVHETTWVHPTTCSMGRDAVPIMIGSGLMLACAARVLYSDLFFDPRHSRSFSLNFCSSEEVNERADAEAGYFRKVAKERRGVNFCSSEEVNERADAEAGYFHKVTKERREKIRGIGHGLCVCITSITPFALTYTALMMSISWMYGNSIAEVHIVGQDSAEDFTSHEKSFGLYGFVNSFGMTVMYSSQQQVLMGSWFKVAKLSQRAVPILEGISFIYSFSALLIFQLQNHLFSGIMCLLCSMCSALALAVFKSDMCGPHYIELQSAPLRPRLGYEFNDTYYVGTEGVLHNDVDVTCTVGDDAKYAVASSILWLLAAIIILADVVKFSKGSGESEDSKPNESDKKYETVVTESDELVGVAEMGNNDEKMLNCANTVIGDYESFCFE